MARGGRHCWRLTPAPDGQRNADNAELDDNGNHTPEWTVAHTHADGTVASPGPQCLGNGGHGCGVYATTQPEIVSRYLGEGTDVVFGLVEMGGETLPCELGYRPSGCGGRHVPAAAQPVAGLRLHGDQAGPRVRRAGPGPGQAGGRRLPARG